MGDVYSSRRLRRVNVPDGATRILRLRRGHTWEAAGGGMRLTSETVQRLRAERVQEVELRRWFVRARAPVAWLR